MEVTYDATLAREAARLLRRTHLRSLLRAAVIAVVLCGVPALLLRAWWPLLLSLPLWLWGQRRVLAALLRPEDLTGSTVGAAYDGDELVLTRSASVRYARGSVRRVVPRGALVTLHSRTPGVPPRVYPAALLRRDDLAFLTTPRTERGVELTPAVLRSVYRAAVRDLLGRPWSGGIVVLVVLVGGLLHIPFLVVLAGVTLAAMLVIVAVTTRLATPYAARVEDGVLHLATPMVDLERPVARLRVRRRDAATVTLRRGAFVHVLPAGVLSPDDLALLTRS